MYLVVVILLIGMLVITVAPIHKKDRVPMVKGNNTTMWCNGSAKALPPDIFLICENRVWQGIPSQVIGGHCYLGKLTMFAPTFVQFWNISLSNHSDCTKRALLTPDCNDNVELLSLAARIALSFFKQLLLDQNSLQHALLQNHAAVGFLLLAQGHGMV